MRKWQTLLALLTLGLLLLPSPSWAQAPLYLVNDSTTVSEVSFRFVGSQTFSTDRLREQIATNAPGFFGRLTNRFAFLPGLQYQTYLFDPITLQKDVVRLRRFYQQNGFPQPQIDYPATQLDTSVNSIHVIFTIREGTPLTIREMAFQTPEGEPITMPLGEAQQREWTAFRRELEAQIGERYTDFKQTQIEDNIRSWLRNRGYAFAQVQSEALIDTAATAVTLRFQIDPGPLGTISEIVIEGNESVSDQVVRRELPFKVGDPFSAEKISAGQRQLFDLNLFRVALANVPEQPRDSTVTVQYRVRETSMRAYSGQLGYGTQPGVTLEGSWRHRNFYGNARTLIVNVVAETGYPENPPNFFPSFLARSALREPDRLFRASMTLHQPYLFSEYLSASVEPFIQERLNPNLGADPTRLLGLNERQFGLNTSLVYNFLPFRSLSLQHSFARVEQFRAPVRRDTVRGVDDLFDKSVFSLSGTFGDADDFLNPTRGFIFRPSVQVGGYPFESGVDFVRSSAGLNGYIPVLEWVDLAGRLFGGILWPFDESRDNLTVPLSAPIPKLRRNRTYQDRFSEYLFYAGGPSDVRGWQSNLAGGKVLRETEILRADYVYRPIGARLKIGANLEMRLPFPGLGENWGTALFVDAAYLKAAPLQLVPPPNISGTLTGPDGRPVHSDPSRLLVGTGAGLRYQTPFGFVRFDLAYKLTPGKLDLRRPTEVAEAVLPDENGGVRPPSAAPTKFTRRFRLHFGIGRSF